MTDTFQKAESWKMFNRIARRYDLLNRLLSGRRDIVWRTKCAKMLPEDRSLTVLDLATGTGDVLLTLFKERPNIKTAIGLDPAANMLSIGQKKLAPYRATFINGDAQNISFHDNSIDIVTMAFGIRNVANIDTAFKEMYRVLDSKGKALILEFSLPKSIFIKRIYLFYFRHILPLIGGLVSGDRKAYQYLNQTVEDFPYGDAFCHRLESAGFTNVRGLPLTFGIATLYSAEKQF